MLLARELSAVLPDVFPANAGALLVNVGSGAARLVREFAGKSFAKNVAYNQKELCDDLRNLHDALLREIDLGFLQSTICPRGWHLDYTEHVACERRRFDDAISRMEKNCRPRRLRDAHGAPQRASTRLRRIQNCWQALGFSRIPSLADI